jgi:hypothetical protein
MGHRITQEMANGVHFLSERWPTDERMLEKMELIRLPPDIFSRSRSYSTVGMKRTSFYVCRDTVLPVRMAQKPEIAVRSARQNRVCGLPF